MQVLRAIAGVVLGYLAYAVSSMLLVGAVMAVDGSASMVAGLVALCLIGAVAGAVTAFTAGGKARIAVAVTAILIALAALANFAMGLGAEPTWYKFGTMLLTTSALVLVGNRIARRHSAVK